MILSYMQKYSLLTFALDDLIELSSVLQMFEELKINIKIETSWQDEKKFIVSVDIMRLNRGQIHQLKALIINQDWYDVTVFK
jgi:hypothetical protein